MEAIDISVVICTYNNAHMLRRALDSVTRQKKHGVFSYEVVVIDNASTDDTKDVVQNIVMNSKVLVRYVQEAKEGYTHAMNRGVKETKSKWVAFIDDDEIAEPNWLAELFAVARERGGQCVGGPCVLAMSKEKRNLLSNTQRAMLGEHMLYKEVQKCTSKHLPGGGNLLVNRKVFDTVGMFDPTFLTGGCDHDFILRARAMNYDIWYVPNAVIRHVIPPNRLTEEYAEWHSLQCGVSFAHREYKKLGRSRIILICFARMGQAVLLNLPLFCWAYMKTDRREKLNRKMLLLRALGYLRCTLCHLLPKIFPQKAFFDRVNFRAARNVGLGTM